MKTIHKKDKHTGKKSPVSDLMLEHPTSHHLLPWRSAIQRSHDVRDLIKIKKSTYKIRKASALLISSISLCLSLILVIGMFEWKTSESMQNIDLRESVSRFDDLLDIPQTQQMQKPPVQVQAPKIIEVDDEEIIEEIEIDLDIEMTEDTRIEQIIYTENEDSSMPEEKADEIFTIVEQQPSPVGGIKAFYDYVSSNIKYPSRATRMGLEGRVFVEFVVEKDGSLTDIKVVKGIGGGCDEEAVRVISSAPKWNPGKQRGQEVRVRMVMPILFRIL